MGSAQAWGSLVLRLVVGAIFVMHGYVALAVLGPAGTAGLIARMGYPAVFATALAWYLVVAHVVGGALIVLGLWTRWAALANVPVMASAVILQHLKQGFFMKAIQVAPDRYVAGGYEFSLLVLGATVALVFLGGGALALGRRR